jgi:hypothetical protein
VERSHVVTPEVRRAAYDARAERANQAAADLATSLKDIAAALDARHILTPAGSGHWHAMQVSRLLRRLAG